MKLELFFSPSLTQVISKLSQDATLDKLSKITIVAFRDAINKAQPQVAEILDPIREANKDNEEGFTKAFEEVKGNDIELSIQFPINGTDNILDKLTAEEIQFCEANGIFNFFNSPVNAQ